MLRLYLINNWNPSTVTWDSLASHKPKVGECIAPKLSILTYVLICTLSLDLDYQFIHINFYYIFAALNDMYKIC